MVGFLGEMSRLSSYDNDDESTQSEVRVVGTSGNKSNDESND